MFKILPFVLGCYLLLICFYRWFWVFLDKKDDPFEMSSCWSFILDLLRLSFKGQLWTSVSLLVYFVPSQKNVQVSGLFWCKLEITKFLAFFAEGTWGYFRDSYYDPWLAFLSSLWSFLFNSYSVVDISDDTFSSALLQKTTTSTGWKVSKYGIFSGPYFPVFELNKYVYLTLVDTRH